MIAVGCLVQWYEIDMFEEYLDSLIKSIGEQKDKVLIDMPLRLVKCCAQFIQLFSGIPQVILHPTISIFILL